MKPVKIYTASPCPYCSRAKELLRARGVPFEEVPVGWDDTATWKALEKTSGMKTMPQVFIDGKCVGGYTELAALDASGKLKELLA